jgi:hypothetical protein
VSSSLIVLVSESGSVIRSCSRGGHLALLAILRER